MKKLRAQVVTNRVLAALCCTLMALSAVGFSYNVLRVSAEGTDIYSLGSIVQLDGSNSSSNIISSTIDGINFTITKKALADDADQYVRLGFNFAKTDLTQAQSIVLELNNPYWDYAPFGLTLIDGEGRYDRATGGNALNWDGRPDGWESDDNWKDSHVYYLSDTLDGDRTEIYDIYYGSVRVPGGFTGYLHIPLDRFFSRGWGDGGPLNISNVTKAEIEIATFFDYGTVKFNIGNIYYAKQDGTKEQLIDSQTIAIGDTGANTYYLWTGYTGSNINSRVEKVTKNLIKTYQLYITNNNQWSPFYISIPQDISAYNGISYYVDLTDTDGEVFFNKFIREYNYSEHVTGEEYYCDSGFAEYIPDIGEPFVGEANVIPQGFKGTIILPFGNFSLPGWWESGGDNNKKLDLNSVWEKFGFTFDVTRGSRSFVIKDFALVSDARQFERVPQLPFVQGDLEVVMPFDYHDDFDLQSDWFTSWDKAAETSIEVVDSVLGVTAVSGKAMKFTCGAKKTVAEASSETALEHTPTDTQKDINGKLGLSFWIKNTSTETISFNIAFDVGAYPDNTRWQVGKTARYMLVNSVTGVESMMNASYGIIIPVNFEGWIRIDFGQFEKPVWETKSGEFDNTLPVTYMVINMNADLNFGNSFVMDSLGYYSTATEITTLFRTPQNSFRNAMGI